MQGICLLFSGRRGLDNCELRQSVLRIPEVSSRLKQAQDFLDDSLTDWNRVDLLSVLQLEKAELSQATALKSLLSELVQVGLYDRYKKFRNPPQFLLGPANDSSAVAFCVGQIDFNQLVGGSEFFKRSIEAQGVTLHTAQLAGAPIEKFKLYKQVGPQQYEVVEMEKSDLGFILEQVFQKNQAQQCVHIGPCHQFRSDEMKRLGLDRIPTINSIDMDPLLSSFWRSA